MNRFMIHVDFEGFNLLDRISPVFITVNLACPFHVFVCRGIFTTEMIKYQHAESFVVVTQQRVRTSFFADSDSVPGCIQWQRQDCDSLKSSRVLRQCAVVGN